MSLKWVLIHKYMWNKYEIKLLKFNRIWNEFEIYIFFLIKFGFRVGTLKSQRYPIFSHSQVSALKWTKWTKIDQNGPKWIEISDMFHSIKSMSSNGIFFFYFKCYFIQLFSCTTFLLIPDLYCYFFFLNIVATNMCLFYLLKQTYIYLDVHFYESFSSFSCLLNSYWRM